MSKNTTNEADPPNVFDLVGAVVNLSEGNEENAEEPDNNKIRTVWKTQSQETQAGQI